VRGNASWAAEKGVSVVGAIDPALGPFNFIYADPTRLNQLLTNLLSNAVNFTGNNGTVTLEVEVDLEHSSAQIKQERLDSAIGEHSMAGAGAGTLAHSQFASRAARQPCTELRPEHNARAFTQHDAA
jgi:signal transduction histidine kinase